MFDGDPEQGEPLSIQPSDSALFLFFFEFTKVLFFFSFDLLWSLLTREVKAV